MECEVMKTLSASKPSLDELLSSVSKTGKIWASDVVGSALHITVTSIDFTGDEVCFCYMPAGASFSKFAKWYHCGLNKNSAIMSRLAHEIDNSIQKIKTDLGSCGHSATVSIEIA